jgi:hypothetical protein
MTRQDPISYANNTDTISSTARTMSDVGFTAAELADADQATFIVTGDAIRFRYDGTAPTATVGFYLPADATPLVVVGNADIRRLQFIRVTTDAELYISLEK